MAKADKKDFVEDDQDRESLPGLRPTSERKAMGDKLSKSAKVVGDTMRQSAMAMELPFTIVAAIVLPGFLGYLADNWLHIKPLLMIVGGALGFVGSLIDIARRYRPR